MVAKGEGIVRDSGKVMYTLLYLKCITNKDLLYSTWNSINVMCRPGWEEAWGEYIHVHVWLRSSAAHLK